MENKVMYVGIDVSKDTLDVAIPVDSSSNYARFKVSNTVEGFAELVLALPAGACCVMESTGVYHTALALYLYDQGNALAVVNPLSVKHFSRMKLKRAKTDKADARLLSQYGSFCTPSLWKPAAEHLVQMRQELGLIEQLIKQRTALSNQRHSLQHSARSSSLALQVIDQQLEQLEASIHTLETNIAKLIKEHHGDMASNLRSIPGIGPKTAQSLIVLMQAFLPFESDKQVIAYAGLAPRIYTSGTTVHGKGHICKLGMSRIRRLLYQCALQAKRCNPACRALYDRLKQQGKPFRVALIAVVNKLLRQAFAIAKSGQTFNLEKAGVKLQPN